MQQRREYRFISAIGTPLDSDERLHVVGLRDHVEDQWAAGMSGILVAGTMGLMQLLREPTYEQLIDAAAECSAGRGEVLIGVGDAGLARTRDRIRLACRYPIDGVVAMCPYFIGFNNAELIDYYRALADASAVPLFIYHLPGLTGVNLSIETVLTLAAHPNIHGIKCSCDVAWIRNLRDAAPEGFRVIAAQAGLVDVLCEFGFGEQLDGIFSVAPAWVVAIGEAMRRGNRDAAAAHQRDLNELLRIVHQYGVFPAFTAMLNARGVAGNYAPAPFRPLDTDAQRRLLNEPIVRRLVQMPAPSSATLSPQV